MARLILLDRDGVINFDSPDYVKNAEEWHPIPGSLEAIAALRSHGFMVGVCTNQAGIARGRLSVADLEAIHARMDLALRALHTRLDGLRYCPHGPEDGCRCRKPQPGMLLEMMHELGSTAQDTIFVGDSMRDVEAAQAAGCRGILVRTGNGPRAEAAARERGMLVEVFADLAAFAQTILSC